MFYLILCAYYISALGLITYIALEGDVNITTADVKEMVSCVKKSVMDELNLILDKGEDIVIEDIEMSTLKVEDDWEILSI